MSRLLSTASIELNRSSSRVVNSVGVPATNEPSLRVKSCFEDLVEDDLEKTFLTEIAANALPQRDGVDDFGVDDFDLLDGALFAEAKEVFDDDFGRDTLNECTG